jgi:hypothetical protein
MPDPSSKKPREPDGPALPPHPDPKDPQHTEWLIDEADAESFPASDPSSTAMPHPKKERKP